MEFRLRYCGYWPLYRFNPELAKQGKNPLQVDSKDPEWNKFQDFLKGEVRYTTLMKQFPERAEKLFKMNEAQAMKRWNYYKKLSSLDYSEQGE